MTHTLLVDLMKKIDRLENKLINLESQEHRSKDDIVVAQYDTNSGQSMTNNTFDVVNFDNQLKDTHSAVTTGASWVFTAPAAGFYLVQAVVLFSSTTTWAETEIGHMRIFKNGSGDLNMARNWGQDSSGSAQFKPVTGTALIELAVSDDIDIRVQQTSGADLALQADANWNYVTIVRVL